MRATDQSMSPEQTRAFSPEEIAALLGIAVDEVMSRLDAGTLRGRWFGPRIGWLVRATDLPRVDLP